MTSTARGPGLLVMSLWFWHSDTYNPSQKKEKKKSCSVFVLHLCISFCLFHQFLYFVVLLCICTYTSTFYIHSYFFTQCIIENHLYAMYILTYIMGLAGTFNLLLPPVQGWMLRPRNTSVKLQSRVTSSNT